MKVLIIEDELSARTSLKARLHALVPHLEVMGEADSISSAIKLFKSVSTIDLVFLDIELSDGNSFEIFKEINTDLPIIFTTAYDAYAIQAFELNSLDYLLKPISNEKLTQALEKFQRLNGTAESTDYSQLTISSSETYRSSFLLEKGSYFVPTQVSSIAYFYIENDIVHCTLNSGQVFMMNETLEQLQQSLDPMDFFRVNRQCIVQRSAIEKVHKHIGGKLKLSLIPDREIDVVVSKDKSPIFKKWMITLP